jgi:plastocyanin
MSLWGYRVSRKLTVACVLLVALGALLPAVGRPSREITLVVRGMAFYLEHDPRTPNPPIELTAGERVRVVLRNEERGMTHDFAVPSFDAATARVNWSQTGDVVIDVPETPGTYAYVCQPHALMMRGRIIVRELTN